MMQQKRCSPDYAKRQIGTFGNIKQRPGAVRKVQNPQHSHVGGYSILIPPDSSIKSAPSQLRFALWHCVAIHDVIFHNIECLSDELVRHCQVVWRNEFEVVSRRMIFGNFAELTALEQAYRQVEPR